MPHSSAPANLQENVDLRRYNTLGVSCKARYFALVKNVDELSAVLDWWRQQSVELLLLGGGSNVILGDEYKGLVLCLQTLGKTAKPLDENRVAITLAAGEPWHETVMWSLQQGYCGLENLALIPGSIGAAPLQNIGAYGVELKDRFLHLDAMHIATGELRRFHSEDCQFGYRDSVFKQSLKGQYIIVSVTLCLTRQPELVLAYPALMQAMQQGEQATASNVAEAVCAVRRSKLPDPRSIGNAGSFFKNPVVTTEQADALLQEFPDMPAHPVEQGVKLAAGWLIEQAGYKGYKRGEAAVHDKQALVLVNLGQASGHDVLALADELRVAVRRRYGIELEIEPQIYV